VRVAKGRAANPKENIMRQIIGAVFISLDGVLQAPGGPEEDKTGGFELGGWLPQFFDPVIGERADKLFTPPFDLLLGRRTYEIFAAHWPYVSGEAKSLGERFDRAAKYVVTGGKQRLDWQNSHRLESLDAIAELKRGEGPPLVIQGSGTLYPQLLRAGLLDRLTLMSFPVIIGSGKRLFAEGTPPCAMRMVEHQITPSGNIIATYQPQGAIEIGSFQQPEPSAAELGRRQKVRQGTW
jgi:dihydrofolate reductase